MKELYISSHPYAIHLQDVLDAQTVYIQHMTATELRKALEAIEFIDCTITDCLLILLDKAGLLYHTDPNGNLCVYTEHGELLELTPEFIFVENENIDDEDDDNAIYSFEWM